MKKVRMANFELFRGKRRELHAWANRVPRMPLLVLGARQVGKTFLITSFGQEAFPAIHVFNFEQTPELCLVFEKDLDPKRIINELSLVMGRPIAAEDLLFFDEIQICPKALTSLKYFCENLPRQAVIAAGSLLGVGLSPSAFPVGKVQELRLYPLTFHEFLSSLSPDTAVFLDSMGEGREYSQFVHETLWRWLEKYLVCGGMPTVVNAFAAQPELTYETVRRCREIQEGLLTQYVSDFAKHSGAVNALHLERVFHGISAQLGKHVDDTVQRFRFSGVLPGVSQYSRLASAFDWLEKASLIKKIPLVTEVKAPLIARAKASLFKCYLFDTGMLSAITGTNPPHLSSKESFKGFLVENFACQELTALGCRIFSWSAEKSSAEIEFILETPRSIVPVEVKSGLTSKAKSLASYIKRYHPQEAYIFGNTTPRQDGVTKRRPLYLISESLTQAL